MYLKICHVYHVTGGWYRLTKSVVGVQYIYFDERIESLQIIQNINSVNNNDLQVNNNKNINN